MQRVVAILALGFALSFTGRIYAGDAFTRPTSLQVTVLQEPADFADPFYSAFVTAGENKFTFVIPQGFRVKGDPATGRITLANREGDRTVTISIFDPAGADSARVDPETCRAFVLKKHPGGKILREFTAGVAGRIGPAFDVQWKPAEDIYVCERIAFVPTAFGSFIFSATSGRATFPETRGNIGLVMGTFRASADGKFRPVHILGEN